MITKIEIENLRCIGMKGWPSLMDHSFGPVSNGFGGHLRPLMSPVTLVPNDLQALKFNLMINLIINLKMSKIVDRIRASLTSRTLEKDCGLFLRYVQN